MGTTNNNNVSFQDTPTHNSSVFGLNLYLLLGITVGSLAVAALLVFLIYRYYSTRNHHQQSRPLNAADLNQEIRDGGENSSKNKGMRSDHNTVIVDITSSTQSSTGSSSTGTTKSTSSSSNSPALALPLALALSAENIPNIGWGQWYSLRELEKATNGFAADRVIGQGGYGIVYRGVLPHNSVVAIKNLLNNKGQAEKEFKVEVEAIGKVRHKNLASLIGYCAEGPRRMLVYEYLDNGNLEQWLHGDLGQISPLTWDIRMKIALGTAKGLAYLHEGLEPKVIHRDVKSSNILLDKKWNPRVSDFGLAKLLGSDASYVTTRVMGTFGCVAPEYASTGMLSEGSDVYSFGVLLMEIISGRSPVDYARPVGEVNMVDWFKGMVASRRGEEVVDPLIKVLPSPRALKRALLVCLRCLDLDANKRPKMGQIVHMLEGDEFPFRSDNRPPRETVTTLAYAGTTIAGKSCSQITGLRR